MRRNFDDYIAYVIHRKITLELGLGINKYIEIKKFAPHTSSVITKNLYPYRLEKGWNHYCLWINPKYEKFWTDSRIKVEIFRFGCKKKREIISYFINPARLQSISAVKHWHIFLS